MGEKGIDVAASLASSRRPPSCYAVGRLKSRLEKGS